MSFLRRLFGRGDRNVQNNDVWLATQDQSNNADSGHHGSSTDPQQGGDSVGDAVSDAGGGDPGGGGDSGGSSCGGGCGGGGGD